jgi:hypothetical protein
MVFVPQFYSYSDFWAQSINLTFLQLLTPETCNAVLNHLTNGTGVESSDDLIRFGRNQSLFHSKYFIIDGEAVQLARW